MGKLPTCNEYMSVIEIPQLLKSDILKKGHVVKRNNTIIRYVGGFCIVFPYETSTQKYAIRCWHASIAEAQERTYAIAKKLKKVQLPYFVNFQYIPEGIATNEGIQPIVVMDWVNATPLKEYIDKHINDSYKLCLLADRFLMMVKDLHKNQLSHGDLQHGNILVKDDGNMILVDYDSMYVSSLEGYTDEIKGLEGYQHQARKKNKYLTLKADYFSELVIYTSLLAFSKIPLLWTDLNINNTETLLFSAKDLESAKDSCIFPILESDQELANLSFALKEAIQCSSIDELSPLEEIVTPFVEQISNKWGNNGYKPIPEDHSNTIGGISKSWHTQPSIDKKYNTDHITNKW